MEEWKEIAHLLAQRIACGCQQPDPCWTCRQVLKRFQTLKDEESLKEHPSDPADR